MKRSLCLVSIVTCVALMFGMIGCGKSSTGLQGYEKYLAVIGETKADALQKLKLQESDLTEAIPNSYAYQVPGTFAFSGYQFKLELLLDRIFDRIYGFTYSTTVEDLSGLTAMREKLIELYGEPSDSNFTEDLLNQMITDKEGSVGNVWSMYRFTEEHHPEYAKCLDQMNEAYGLDQVYAWNLTLQAICGEDGTYRITMAFSVGRDLSQQWQPGQSRE